MKQLQLEFTTRVISSIKIKYNSLHSKHMMKLNKLAVILVLLLVWPGLVPSLLVLQRHNRQHNQPYRNSVYRSLNLVSNSQRLQHPQRLFSNTDDNYLFPGDLVANIEGAFSIASQEDLTKDVLSKWEAKVKLITDSVRDLPDSTSIIQAYSKLLEVCSPVILDPLQSATFELVSNGVIDALISRHPQNTAITELVDELTDAHLNFIEKFSILINDGGGDGYSQSANQEQLSYQFAGLAKMVYSRLSNSLGPNFDSSASTIELRLSNWVSPIYARLQRRFVRFSASSVDEKLEDIKEESFDRLLGRISIQVIPAYKLHFSSQDDDSLNTSPRVGGSLSGGRAFPAWQVAELIIKLLRNTVAGLELPSLEAKVLRTFQGELSNGMRSLSNPLEKLSNERPTRYSDKDVMNVEAMLNIGHAAVAAVLTLWHVRYNILGVPDSEGNPIKDYLRPAVIHSRESMSEVLPKVLREEVYGMVDELMERIQPKSHHDLEPIAIMAHAVRITAGEELRALTILNSDADEWPASRDSIYVSVLTAVLTDALTEQSLDKQLFYENLISLAALEETIGCREPRASCAEGFQVALRNAAAIFQQKNRLSVENLAVIMDRVHMVEQSLGMILRLEEGTGPKVRMAAFKESIEIMIAESERQRRPSPFKEVEAAYPVLAQLFGIKESTAKAFIQPLGQAKFDKTVGSLLMNADLAISMPDMGSMFRNQILTLGESISLSQEQADVRLGLLAGAIFESLMETALEEGRRMNIDRSEILFKKAYNVYRHPLLTSLEAATGKDLKSIGVKMVTSRLRSNLVVELMRLIESVRQNLSGAGESRGWSAPSNSQNADPDFIAFLSALQGQLLQEYSNSSKF